MSADYYEDGIDVVGEVRTADLDTRTFVLLVVGSGRIAGRFHPYQEAVLTEALQQHGRRRLRVSGRARYNSETSKPEAFVEVQKVTLVDSDLDSTVLSHSTWERIAEIASRVSDEDLAALPADFVQKADMYLDED